MDINTLMSNIASAFAPLARILAILAAFVFLGVLLDYLSGTIAARINHEWESCKAREGIWHKVGIFICILVATLLDGLIIVAGQTCISLPIEYKGFFAPLVEIMFILTEFCSILENLNKMGVPIPPVLVKGIKAFKKAADEKATEALPDEEDPEAEAEAEQDEE